MKPRLFPVSILSALLAAFGLIAVACGDGGEPSLEDYFQQLVKLTDDADEEGAELGAALDRELETASDEEAITAYRSYFDQSLPAGRAFLHDLEGIDTPEVVEGAHDRLVAFFEALTEVAEGISDELGDVQSAAEVEALLVERVGPLLPAKEAACFELQEIAHDNEVDVDLGCEA